MRLFEISMALGLTLYSQAAMASVMTQTALYEASAKPVTDHVTSKGTIICRDPQIKFNEQEWFSDATAAGTDGLVREHMLVDLIVHKRLLHKQQTYVDALFQGKRQDLEREGISRYFIRSGGRCGNSTKLVIEATYDAHQILTRYRFRYYEDGGRPLSIDSEWIK